MFIVYSEVTDTPRISSFQKKVYLYYSLIVSVLIMALTTAFSIYAESMLRASTENRLKDNAYGISTQFDSMVLTMDTIATQVVSSRSIQEIFSRALDFDKPVENYFDFNYTDRTKAYEVLLSINSPKDTARRICVFNNTYNFVSVGKINNDLLNPTSNTVVFDSISKAENQHGGFLLLPTHPDSWVKQKDAAPVISLIRPITATYGMNNKLGFVEVQQPYSQFASICEELERKNDYRLYVVDLFGNVIYPSALQAEAAAEYYYGRAKNTPDIQNVENIEDKSKELLYTFSSNNTGWEIMLIAPYKEIMAPVRNMRIIIYLVGFVILLVSLGVMFVVTSSLTAPIRKLRGIINEVSLDETDSKAVIESSDNEIEQLWRAYNEMLQRFRQAAAQTVLARENELNAHLLALQSQMNPHFLYNSLSGISAAGQEAGSEKIVSMCLCLSDMLRYTASRDESPITLRDEIRHACNYLEMMKFRYEERLLFEFHIAEECMGIQIQKHLLQPIIENAFMHGYKSVRPPWRLIVKASSSETHWRVSVEDNGAGFDQERIEQILACFKEIDSSFTSGAPIKNLTIGGMALQNIYSRLKIMYKESALLLIENNELGGATVTIGGQIRPGDSAC